MIDTMEPHGLVLSLSLVDTLQSCTEHSALNRSQVERFNAMILARAVMENIVAQTNIRTAFRSRLPPATKYLILPVEDVRV